VSVTLLVYDRFSEDKTSNASHKKNCPTDVDFGYSVHETKLNVPNYGEAITHVKPFSGFLDH